MRAQGEWGCCQSRVVVVKVVLPTSVSYSLGSPNLLLYPQRRSCGCSDPHTRRPGPQASGAPQTSTHQSPGHRAPRGAGPLAVPSPSHRGALSARLRGARCACPRTLSPGRPPSRPCPRRSVSPDTTECRSAMMSARHVHPTLAFEPRMQGRIKSGPPPKSGATTNSEISNRGCGGRTAPPWASGHVYQGRFLSPYNQFQSATM